LEISDRAVALGWGHVYDFIWLAAYRSGLFR
jgi:hypothetical protein